MAESTAKEWSVRALSVELGIDRTVLARRLKGLAPARTSGKNRYFYMADVFRHLTHGEVIDPAAESGKLNKARREKIELEKAEMESRLIDFDSVQKLWVDMITNMKTKLLALPSDAVMPVQACENEQEVLDVLTELVREALSELAEETRTDITPRRRGRPKAST